MCGIVGYIGDKKATPILINGLLRLEYRGYDSAGIAVMEGNNIVVKKDKGRVNNLYNLEGIDSLKGTIGIAHTRWATHGKPSKENSHPHMDNSGSFAVVHNGIIENYHELRNFLIEKGYNFLSQTDTEIIPNLIHYYFTKENDVLKAIKDTCNDLKGSYALEILAASESDKMFVVRKDSPLVIGKGNGENYISSDIPAILSYTKDFYLLDDNEIVELSKDNVIFYDKDLNKINKLIKSIEWGAASAEKDGYEDFMLKEINEQPNAIRETIGAKLDNGHVEIEDLNFTKEYLKSLNKIYIVACGTAMHAGLVAKTIFERLCKIPVEVDIASEFRYRDPIVNDKTLAIYISQSGETADTIAALKLAKSKGAKTLAISNVIGSSITREADYSIYTHAGPEIAVASTKAYTSQVVLLSILGLYFTEKLETADLEEIKELKKDILRLPSQVEEILKDLEEIKQFAKKVYKEKDMFFLGRGTDYAVSLEGSLKLKEISYIHSEAYASGELKHGPIALIENGITVVATMTDKRLVEKSISNVQEVVTRGAKVLLITSEDIKNDGFDTVIKIPKTSPLISPILSVIPMQVLSYYISKEKGLDVDKPRNLAKSVTVE
jgi:glucosamine--fructose-6-phosphate aminotransferase (isomerizing)